ncbi:MAG: peptidoglycan-binding protein LysM [Chitinophagaceae bacterium]
MGLFSFIKDMGKKIFKSKDEEEKANPGIEGAEILAKQKAAIKSYIDGIGLNIQNLDFTLDSNGKLTLTGDCQSKADFEKVSLTAGNIAGVAEVDNQMTIAGEDATPDSSYYTVEKGDSLWKIAEKNYGDGSKYPVIFEANVPMIKDPDEIYPGQVLRIPGLSA